VGRLIALILGGFGVGAYLRRRRKRRAGHEYSPAEELRSKLAEARSEDAEPAQPEPQSEPELESDLEQRRREVHERARGSIDDLS
jgi:hypothetical protein